jgi:hypothetical protein
VELNGADQFVEAPASASFNGITAGVTAAGWAYKAGSDGGAISWILARHVTTSMGPVYGLGFSTDRPTFDLEGFPGFSAIMSPAIAAHRWVHVAGTYDGQVVRLYLNGVEIDSREQPGSLVGETASTVLIGGDRLGAPGVTGRFRGRLDEVRLYSRALTPEEIAYLAR